ITNTSIASTVGYTFTHWHNANGADLFIAANINTTQSASDNPPVIELGGSIAQLNFSANYTTGATTGVAIAASNASLLDPDDTQSGPNGLIVKLDVSISDAHSGAAEFLQLNAAGQTFLASHPELTVTGLDSQTVHISGDAADTVYQTLLRDLVYVNTDTTASLNTSDRHITVDAQDGSGLNATERTTTISLTNGNVAPTVDGASVLAGTVTEDVTTAASGSVIGHDANGDTLTYSGDSSSTLGTFDVVASTGAWSYALNNASAAVQALAGGQVVTENYAVTVNDGHGGTTNTSVAITINGTNDAAVIGGTDTGSVTEDGTQIATGTLTVNDVDTGQNSFTAASNLAGTHGSLTIDSSGDWTYTLNNSDPAVQALPQGAHLSDTVTVQSIDGTTHNIAITITGT